jgi:hypothetical protein
MVRAGSAARHHRGLALALSGSSCSRTIANVITGSPCRYRRGTRGSLRSGNVSVQAVLRRSHGERLWMRSELPACLDWR